MAKEEKFDEQIIEINENVTQNDDKQSFEFLRKKHAKEMGENNRKPNVYYHPLGYDYALCFYHNIDGYFIFDDDNLSDVLQHTWTAKVHNKRIEPYTKINNKTTLLSRFLMNTPSGLECDHINHLVGDARKCNLRNCTSEENKHNNSKGQGKVIEKNGRYIIVNFPKYISSDVEFDTEEEAYKKLYALQDENFGEFSFRKSQEIANDIETNQFHEGKFIYCGGNLEEISQLPYKNIYKLRLNNIERDFLNKVITEDNAYERLFKLLDDYKKSKKEDSQK